MKPNLKNLTPNQLFSLFKTSAEDLAYEKKKRETLQRLMTDIAKSDLGHVDIFFLSKVISDQIGIPPEMVSRDILTIRLQNVSRDNSGVTVSLVLLFLRDPLVCYLGDPGVYHTRRGVLYTAYSAWCKACHFVDDGKRAFFAAMADPAVVGLGVRHGTDSGGNDLYRGVCRAEDAL